MPGYKTHDVIGTVSVIPVSIAALYMQLDIENIIILSGGLLIGTYLLSPDLDLYSRIYVRWGIFRWIWLPYQKIVSHRSWVSHSGPLSSSIRMLYLWLWLFPFWSFLMPYLQIYGLYAMMGIMVADILHVAADKILGE